jgi:hypothetical protein
VFVPVGLVCVFVCCVILGVFFPGIVGHPGVLVWQCGLRQAQLWPCFLPLWAQLCQGSFQHGACCLSTPGFAPSSLIGILFGV